MEQISCQKQANLYSFFVLTLFAAEYKALCLEAEHFETEAWAAAEILKHEQFPTFLVVDACTGTGILSEAARAVGHETVAIDKIDWGYDDTWVQDWLKLNAYQFQLDIAHKRFSVFMNPPFTLAEEFVEQALALGAEKVICFQRLPWYESEDRQAFWDRVPCTKIYVCGNRVTCWRNDISPEERKARSGSSTAYAFYVFEPGTSQKHPTAHRIYKPKQPKKAPSNVQKRK